MEIVFETKRLFLRKFTSNDAPLLLQLNSDPEVIKYIHELPLKTLVQSLEVIQDIILPQYKLNLGRWAIHLKGNNAFMGWCGLKYEKQETDLGYRLMKKYWGNGYATEAAIATIQYGFYTLQLEKIIARAHRENIASQKVLHNAGFKYVKDEMDFGEPLKIYSIAKAKLLP